MTAETRLPPDPSTPAPDTATLRAIVSNAWGVEPAGLDRIERGADPYALRYRVYASDGAAYFLKLRPGAPGEAALCLPRYWFERTGMAAIVAPIATADGRLYADTAWGALTLYPWHDGEDGFARPLSPAQWETLGRALRALHDSAPPPELADLVPPAPGEAAAAQAVAAFERSVDGAALPADPVQAELLALWRAQRHRIRQALAQHAQLLAQAAARAPLAPVICHGDLHAGNVLLDGDDALFVVDWDTLCRAPRERDLMFIGGGVGGIWRDAPPLRHFWRGYGDYRPDAPAIALFRHTRILTDLAETIAYVYDADAAAGARSAILRLLYDTFAPGDVFDIARASFEAATGIGDQGYP